ncbi:MAG: hypothetical protein ACREOU_07945 [Candidatus Eiseniibacteriota bacterium]
MSQEPRIHPIWVFVPDLMLGTRIQELAKASQQPIWLFGQAGHVVEGLEVTAEMLATTPPTMVPFLVIVDLNAPGGQAFEILETVRTLRTNGRFTPQVLAFYAHTDTAVRERAEAVGADRIVPRSALVKRFAHWLEELAVRPDVN